MLQCTQTAATILRQLRRGRGLPDAYGVRQLAPVPDDGPDATT